MNTTEDTILNSLKNHQSFPGYPQTFVDCCRNSGIKDSQLECLLQQYLKLNRISRKEYDEVVSLLKL